MVKLAEPLRALYMAYRSRTGGTRLRVKAASLLWLVACVSRLNSTGSGGCPDKLPGYARAEDAFMHLTLDERVKLQVLLTAAGYWPAVPNADFSTRLFNAILQFEADNGFAPLGVVNDQQMDRLVAVAGPYLNNWRFALVRHPMTSSQIWVPVGLPWQKKQLPRACGL